jgi:hypothetical protein
MQYKKTIIIVVLGALAVAMTIGAVAYRSVFAATPTTVTATTTTQPDLTWGIGKGHLGGYTAEDLADALGITVDELNTAYQTAYSTALEQAVSQDLITQLQADELSTNGSAFPFGKRWQGWLTQNGIDFDTFLAETLGITVDELRAAYQTAYFTRIDQAVTDGGLTEEQADLIKGRYALSNDSTFQSSMQSAYTAAVNAAVASGVITQAQADQILSASANLFAHGMRDWGGRGGLHRHGGDWVMGGATEITP